MAQYSTDFSEYTTGQQPSDMTKRWVTASVAWTVIESAISGVTGGKVLELTRSGGNSRSGLSLDAIDSDADRADVEVLVKTQHPTTANDFGGILFSRGSGISTLENLYRSGVRWAATESSLISDLAEYNSGSFAQGPLTAQSLSADTWYWIRARWNGTTRQLRFWADGDSEPGTWAEEDTDASITAAGWVGLFSFASTEATQIYDFLSVGTNGDTAPGIPPSGAFVGAGLTGGLKLQRRALVS
jgi:hypothetical protein